MRMKHFNIILMFNIDAFVIYIYIFANDYLIHLHLDCTDCRFTCHYRCRALIQLDCSWDRGSGADYTCVVEHTVETDTNVVRTFEFGSMTALVLFSCS